MFRLVLMACLLWAMPIFADVTIEGDRKVPNNSFAVLSVKGSVNTRWKIVPKPVKQVIRNGELIFSGLPGVTYTVFADVVDFEKKSFDGADADISFDPLPVIPVDPPGPGPKPEPTPPGPKPTSEMRVLFIYESADALTREQQNVLYSTKVVEYLNRKCAKDGNVAGWRRWDKDIVLTKEADNWKKMLEASKPFTSLPKVVVFSGKTGESMDLPKTADELLTILKQYGGE